MKRLFIVTLFFIILSSNFAYAEDNVGLLPTNPFYFIKEWQRGVKSFFTVSPIKRSELELAVIREKSLEIRKLQAIDPPHFQLYSYLEDLINKTLRQITFYFETNQKISVIETVALLPLSPEQWSEFKDKLEPLVENRGFPAIVFLNQLEKSLPDEGKKEISKLEVDLILKLKGKAIANSKILDSLPVESLDTIEALDTFREYADDRTDLKNKLNQLRQKSLDWAKANNKVDEAAAGKAIALAEDFVAALNRNLPEANNTKLVNLLTSKAKFNLDQVKASLEVNNYSDAFGQASLAFSAASRAFNQISRTAGDAAKDIKKLKAQYDQTGVASARIENLLLKAADLLSKDSVNIEQVNSLLEEARVLLAEI